MPVWVNGLADSIAALLKRQKVRYLLAGGWNTAFGYGVYAGPYYLLHEHIHYMVIAVMANVIAISMAYLTYKMFVFGTRGNYLREYLKFYGVYGLTAIIGLVALPFCIEVMKINPYVAPLLISGVTVAVSYLGHKHFSFKQYPARK